MNLCLIYFNKNNKLVLLNGDTHSHHIPVQSDPSGHASPMISGDCCLNVVQVRPLKPGVDGAAWTRGVRLSIALFNADMSEADMSGFCMKVRHGERPWTGDSRSLVRCRPYRLGACAGLFGQHARQALVRCGSEGDLHRRTLNVTRICNDSSLATPPIQARARMIGSCEAPGRVEAAAA